MTSVQNAIMSGPRGPIDTSLKTAPKSLEQIDTEFNDDVKEMADAFMPMIQGISSLQIKLNGAAELELVKELKDSFDSFVKAADNGEIPFESDEKETWTPLVAKFSELMQMRINELNKTMKSDPSSEETKTSIGGDPHPCSIAGVGLWFSLIMAVTWGTNHYLNAPFGETLWGLITGWLAVIYINFEKLIGDFEWNTVGGFKIAMYRVSLWMNATFHPSSFIEDPMRIATTGAPTALVSNFTWSIFFGKVSESWMAKIIFLIIWVMRVICNSLGTRFIDPSATSSANVAKAMKDETIGFNFRGGPQVANMEKLLGMLYVGLPANSGVAGDPELSVEEKTQIKGYIARLQTQTNRLLDQDREWKIYQAEIKRIIDKNKASLSSLVIPPDGGGRRRSRRRMPKSKRGGRSRMRKMRTKKRRMSKRKYRR